MSETPKSGRAARTAEAIRERLSYANVMATLAVFGVLAGGGAYAASKIGPSDIAKNAVRGKHIKKNAVISKHIKNGQVKAAELADPEAFHVVGAPGEPAFGDGGESDCLWQNPLPATGLLANANPVSFFKDADGLVHLAGVPFAEDGPGGDGACDNSNISDNAIFRLPAGYRPERLEVFPSGNDIVGLNMIVPEGGLTVDGVPIPEGTVMAISIDGGNATTLDGFTFRAAAGPATASSPGDGPPRVSLRALRNLLG